MNVGTINFKIWYEFERAKRALWEGLEGGKRRIIWYYYNSKMKEIKEIHLWGKNWKQPLAQGGFGDFDI